MKVTGFDNIKRFKHFELKKKIGEHSWCKFSFTSYKFDDYTDSVGKQVKIIEDGRCLLVGKVTAVDFVYSYTENIVSVTIHSHSFFNDKEIKTRVFQEEKQKYSDVLKKLGDKISVSVDASKNCSEKELKGAIVQNETDYAFIKRITKEAYGEDLIVNSSLEQTKYGIGSIDSTLHKLEKPEIAALTLTKIKDCDILDFSIVVNDDSKECREFVDVGKKISWENSKYLITELTLKLQDGLFKYKCIAKSMTPNKDEAKAEKNYLTFKGKVTETKDPDNLGRIRIDFTDENVEDMTSENKIWQHVLTPYTAKHGGFVFIPDKDDIVETIWDGTTFYVLGCIRQEALADRYQDVNLKQIGNLHEKNICFSDKSLKLTSKETTVEILDEEVKIVVQDVLIDADKKQLKINVSGKSEIIMDKNFECKSGSIDINASSKMKLQGNSGVSIN